MDSDLMNISDQLRSLAKAEGEGLDKERELERLGNRLVHKAALLRHERQRRDQTMTIDELGIIMVQGQNDND